MLMLIIWLHPINKFCSPILCVTKEICRVNLMLPVTFFYIKSNDINVGNGFIQVPLLCLLILLYKLVTSTDLRVSCHVIHWRRTLTQSFQINHLTHEISEKFISTNLLEAFKHMNSTSLKIATDQLNQREHRLATPYLYWKMETETDAIRCKDLMLVTDFTQLFFTWCQLFGDLCLLVNQILNCKIQRKWITFSV
jgi:hypothetical protein